MSTADVIDSPTQDGQPVLDPLMDTHVYLTGGMRVRMDRCTGDVPVMEVISGRTHLVVGFGVGEVTDIGAEHVAVAEEFATAACALRDEMRMLAAAG